MVDACSDLDSDNDDYLDDGQSIHYTESDHTKFVDFREAFAAASYFDDAVEFYKHQIFEAQTVTTAGEMEDDSIFSGGSDDTDELISDDPAKKTEAKPRVKDEPFDPVGGRQMHKVPLNFAKYRVEIHIVS